MLNPADEAPEFTLPRDGGEEITLSTLRPAPVVLFFYPRDDTSGCTKEAIAFTELNAEFEALGVKVFGISKDTVTKHDKFRDKHSLGIPLLSDAEGDVCESYGVWKEKSMYGKKFFGIVRTTVLIDGDGVVARVWPKVKVVGHAEEVLEAVKAL
ncbi:Putative peroxiredoxin bcp [Roseovarius albus]|uniref:thioredoxin-dependent peroxiredoxin n=1 Tax=Roseovarius albus TaxID=1247867 RepID=A0A1X6ZBG3_9RHOB|nr:peroxiredoxin [Roseovarius albus]SLN46612.1 Putative peroxiredoxin bcp [Roseovarius albus]